MADSLLYITGAQHELPLFNSQEEFWAKGGKYYLNGVLLPEFRYGDVEILLYNHLVLLEKPNRFPPIVYKVVGTDTYSVGLEGFIDAVARKTQARIHSCKLSELDGTPTWGLTLVRDNFADTVLFSRYAIQDDILRNVEGCAYNFLLRYDSAQKAVPQLIATDTYPDCGFIDKLCTKIIEAMAMPASVFRGEYMSNELTLEHCELLKRCRKYGIRMEKPSDDQIFYVGEAELGTTDLLLLRYLISRNHVVWKRATNVFYVSETYNCEEQEDESEP